MQGYVFCWILQFHLGISGKDLHVTCAVLCIMKDIVHILLKLVAKKTTAGKERQEKSYKGRFVVFCSTENNRNCENELHFTEETRNFLSCLRNYR